VLTPACRLAGVLQEASEAFFAALDRHTLDGLVVRPARLRRLLGLHAR
jgi:Rrf2 family transcriptional regulator, nitric oxide-sensitive transcriptional repressor